MILKSVIRDAATNSVEATWVNSAGVNVKCRSYAGEQMDDLVSDLGADASTHASLIATTRANVIPYTPPPPPIPFSVTSAQGKAAIYAAGLLPAVEAAVAAASKITQIFWASAPAFTRDSPTINALAAQLGLSSAQVDALFVAAAAIEA